MAILYHHRRSGVFRLPAQDKGLKQLKRADRKLVVVQNEVPLGGFGDLCIHYRCASVTRLRDIFMARHWDTISLDQNVSQLALWIYKIERVTGVMSTRASRLIYNKAGGLEMRFW